MASWFKRRRSSSKEEFGERGQGHWHWRQTFAWWWSYIRLRLQALRWTIHHAIPLATNSWVNKSPEQRIYYLVLSQMRAQPNKTEAASVPKKSWERGAASQAFASNFRNIKPDNGGTWSKQQNLTGDWTNHMEQYQYNAKLKCAHKLAAAALPMLRWRVGRKRRLEGVAFDGWSVN